MRVLFRQHRTPFGEIDLICLDHESYVFVEVKTRRTPIYGPPQASITPRKFRHMAAAAQIFLAERGWHARPWRLDVMAIDQSVAGETRMTHFPAIDSPAAF